MAEKKRMISYDPVIHAGHILTASSMIISTLAWAIFLRADVDALQRDVTSVRENVKEQEKKTEEKIFLANKDFKDGITGIRSDMNTWFIRIDDKLDKKMDKR